jgi:LacI family transcriptional regulator
MLTSRIPKVAILLETSRLLGRGMHQGIVNYSRIHAPWAFHVWLMDELTDSFSLVKWKGDGIIARIPNEQVEKAIQVTGLPTVGVMLTDEQRKPSSSCFQFSEINVESYEAAVLCAEHLLELQFKTFAFVGERNNVSWSVQRQKGFCDRIAQEGFSCQCYVPPKQNRYSWNDDRVRLGHWLAKLPKPIGLLAAFDFRGKQVIDVCFEQGIKVPDEIAVIGIDNDQLICEYCCYQPMSSIGFDTVLGGYKAAEMLDLMMKGNQTKPVCFRIPPLHVVVRQSTNRYRLDDPLLVQALEIIRSQTTHRINVEQLCRQLDVSKNTLEKKFKQQFGCSILVKINQAIIEQIKILLSETNMTIAEIAEHCSFDSDSNLCKFFKRETGTTMRQWRLQAKQTSKTLSVPFG